MVEEVQEVGGSFHAVWMEETMGVDGAGSSSGMGPATGESKIGVRAEDVDWPAKWLRRNILSVPRKCGPLELCSKLCQTWFIDLSQNVDRRFRSSEELAVRTGR